MPRLIAVNRRARHHYTILEHIEAGIALQGTEIKSLRQGHAMLADSYCLITPQAELFWVGGHIPVYSHGNRHNHDPTRRRKLLVHKKQILRLQHQVKAQRLTLVPLRLYFVRSFAKLEIALAKGKSAPDKRHTLRERQMNRDAARALAHQGRQ